ncbi:MAG: DUF31 family protein [Mycoplasma sp.]
MRLKLISLLGAIPAIVVPTIFTTSCGFIHFDDGSTKESASYDAPHRFINERTFSLRIQSTNYFNYGTIWLFYKLNNDANDYSYYFMTNMHVTSPLIRFNQAGPVKLALAFENDNDVVNKTLIGNNQEVGRTFIASCHYNELTSLNTNQIGNDKLKIYYNQYFNYDGFVDTPTTRRSYNDISVGRLNLNSWKNQSGWNNIAPRLNHLNTYANSHNKWLLQFDDASSKQNLSNIYTAGYPLVSTDEQQPYGDFSNRLAIQNFDMAYGQEHYGFNDYQNYFYDPKKPEEWSDAAKNSVKLSNYRRAFYVDDHNTENRYFGGGASGSLMISVANPNDPSTYKAEGIYWGTSTTNNLFGLHRYLGFEQFKPIKRNGQLANIDPIYKYFIDHVDSWVSNNQIPYILDYTNL